MIDRVIKNLKVSEDTFNNDKDVFESRFGKIEVFFEYDGIDFKVTESYDYNNDTWSFTYTDKEADLIAEQMSELLEESELQKREAIISYREEQAHKSYLRQPRFYL